MDTGHAGSIPVDQRSWQPILEGSARDVALEAARAIATALVAPSRPASAPSASLSGGDAGEALFFAYLAQAFPGEGHEEVAAGRLDRAIAALAEDSPGPSLCSGFAGVAWATAHLQRLLGLEASPGDPHQEIDEALDEVLDPSATPLPSELLYGLAGIGVYYLERDPSPSARLGLERVVERLEASSVPTPQGCAWAEAEWLADGQDSAPDGEPRFNLGLSHGVPGAVGILAQALARGVSPERTHRLLEGAVAWLLAQATPEPAPVAFPYLVTPSFRPPADTRSAWCYGDPGVAAALLAAGRAAQRPDWQRAALEVALRAARRPMAEAEAVDAGLCHGAAGLALTFARLFQGTGEERLRDAGVRWFEQALALRRPGHGIAGFRSWTPGEDGGQGPEWSDDPGFLTGASGIGLALLAGATSVEPAWDSVLLLRPPPAGVEA
jgi:hypothetical protein